MAENNGRELGWGDTITRDDEFPEIPEGDYTYRVDYFERSQSSGKGKLPQCNMAVVYFNIQLPSGEEAQIKENFILHTSLEWKLSQLFTSVGLKKKGEELRMDWNKLPGLTGRCHVKPQPDKNDPDKKYTHITKFYPAGNSNSGKNFQAGSF